MAGSVGASAVAEQKARSPSEPEDEVRADGEPDPGHERSCHTQPQHPAGHRAEAGQPDVHPAVEQEHDQGNGDDPLVDLDAQGPEVGEQVGRHRGYEKEQRRARDLGQRGDPAGTHREQQCDGCHHDHQRERSDILHPGSWGRTVNADQTSRHTRDLL